MHCKYDAENGQGVRIMGRAAQGVKLIDLAKKNDVIASVCRVISEEEEDNVEAAVDTLPSDDNLFNESDNNAADAQELNPDTNIES